MEDEDEQVKSSGSASANRSVPAVEGTRDEPAAGKLPAPESTSNATLMERVLERANLTRALKQVRSNRGAPGIDGMSVDALPSYLKEHWPEIRAQLVAGSYRPQPVRRVEIPKPDGRTRPLGIPTVLDRFIQQAIAQVVAEQWEPHFHPCS
jgi:retron-type reverse transcriptase